MIAKRVLIVDDDPLIRQMIRGILEVATWTVTEAGDGIEGLRRAETLPSVILLDPMMIGVDGYAVCRELKANSVTQAIPVVFVTASEDLRLNRLAYAAGAVACLSMPFRRDALIALLETAVASAERRAHKTKRASPSNRTYESPLASLPEADLADPAPAPKVSPSSSYCVS